MRFVACPNIFAEPCCAQPPTAPFQPLGLLSLPQIPSVPSLATASGGGEREREERDASDYVSPKRQRLSASAGSLLRVESDASDLVRCGDQ